MIEQCTGRTFLAVVAAAVLTCLLFGCASNGVPAQRAPLRTLGAHKANLGQAQLPADAAWALGQLGTMQPSYRSGSRGVSTTLPVTVAATDSYLGAGGAGYITTSADVSLAPSGMTLQPPGTTLPDSFSYIIYRIDDVAQLMSSLELSFGLTSPGAQVGVAAYNWGYGTLGRWEPLYFGPPAAGLNVPINALQADYTNAGGDVAFVIFCLSPSSLELQSLTLNAATVNPNYDELEPNDFIGTANPLPAFPFSGYRGNIGIGGQYDGSADDYFWFTGNVGDMCRFTITPAIPSPEFFRPFVFDSAGNETGEYLTDPSTGVVTLVVVITTNQLKPLMVNVWHTGAIATDYTIDGLVETTYGEQENNDSQLEANQQMGPVFYVNGNLGTGGNDGDMTDWFSFTPAVGDKPILGLLYDTGTLMFDLDGAPPTITDQNGLVLCEGRDASEPPYLILDAIVFDFPAEITGAEAMPLVVNLNPVSGGSNYWLERFQ